VRSPGAGGQPMRHTGGRERCLEPRTRGVRCRA
jgi:hypothetical protein